MKATIQAIKGTRDYYPEEMAIRNWLYQTVRQVSESFGYQEYEAPFLESIELYAAKSGEELVKEQSFVFPDRGGDLITLRPELTPSLARMIAQHQRQLIYPVRWWSWGPFWRYERPQKGRTREFFQWNIDLMGVDTPEADGEMAAIAASFLRACGLSAEQVTILVNNRRLMEGEIRRLKIPAERRTEVFRLIDRRDKMSTGKWQAYAKDIGLSDEQFEGLKAVLADDKLWQKSEEMQRFFSAVEALGAADYVRYAPHIIRGLDYYTGTVFECWDVDGEFRAILGGGRYDNLVGDVGGEPLPGVGFAMGDLVVSLVLQKFNCLPENLGTSPAEVLVTVFDENSMVNALRLAAELRQGGLNAAIYPEPAKLGKQFKYADRMGMRAAAILGPDELSAGQVAVKDLATGSQQTVRRQAAAGAIRQLLDSAPPS
ncbi:MAG: histidine--tRNA ligase [Anaerolineales bacterium]|jgi:histidyl-tRNA synthetase